MSALSKPIIIDFIGGVEQAYQARQDADETMRRLLEPLIPDYLRSRDSLG